VRPDTVADLWAHARELAQRASTEGDPAPARRALVALAIAGSGDDRAEFEAVAREVLRAFARIGLDPLPLFDAASALAEDATAREILVTLPRHAGDQIRDELLGRLLKGRSTQ
jgi:hypothetical protein